MSEDYDSHGSHQISSRQESGTATIADPSASQTVSVTFDKAFSETPTVVGLASSDSNGVSYSNVSKTGFDITTAGAGGTAVDVGYIVTGER